MVCMLNGLCSEICGGASFREERLTLAEPGKMFVLKINDEDDDDDDNVNDDDEDDDDADDDDEDDDILLLKIFERLTQKLKLRNQQNTER